MTPAIAIPDGLADERVALRPIAERDIPDILNAHEQDTGLARLIGMSRPPSAAELGRTIDHAPADLATGARAELTITRAGEDELRGVVVLHSIAWERGTAAVGIWVAPWARRRGIGLRALRLTCDWAFASLGLGRLELSTGPENEPMIGLALHAGFAQEGVLRSFMREQPDPLERAVFALVRGEEAT
jgi:RimJ/RimL family protein N-acetyltransferase